MPDAEIFSVSFQTEPQRMAMVSPATNVARATLARLCHGPSAVEAAAGSASRPDHASLPLPASTKYIAAMAIGACARSIKTKGVSLFIGIVEVWLRTKGPAVAQSRGA